MPRYTIDTIHLATKSSILKYIDEYYNKNAHLGITKTSIRAKIAKNAEMAVKTAKIGQKLREKEERDYIEAYGRPKNGPVSTPNPNMAFKQKKKKDWNVFDHLDWASDVSERVSK